MITEATPKVWYPRLYPKQMELFNDRHRFLLVHGPRRSTKTWACMARILRHAFDTNGARVAMICPTLKNSKAGGIWVDMTTIAIPEWERANIGFKVVEGPKMTGDTRMSYFIIRNRWGGTSEVQLHSLDYVHDVEEKFKGTKFSMFYFSELDNFNDPIVFKTTIQSLRMTPEIPYEEHFWIGDTNPPADGPDNWMYKVWLDEAKRDNHPNKSYQSRFHDLAFTLDDNIEMDPRDREDLIESLKGDQNLYNRYVLGMWVEDSRDNLFGDVFKKDRHIIGDTTPADKKDWEIITPSPNCHQLYIGIDPGDVNHAAVIIEIINTPTGEPIYSVIDEVVSVGKNVSLREFTEAICRQMDFWESFVSTSFHRKVLWKTWSDSSVLRYRSAANSDEALLIRNLSKGRIQCRAAEKFTGSVETRVRIVHRLLWENRLFVSAQCTETIKMLTGLRKGPSKLEPIAPRKLKHAFDAMSYPILQEEPAALEKGMPSTSRTAPSVVSL